MKNTTPCSKLLLFMFYTVTNRLPIVAHIVARANQQDLMLFYNLPAYTKDSVDAFLATIARTQKLTKKVYFICHSSKLGLTTATIQGGELDLAAASRIVLRDWATNKLPRYTIPLKTPEEDLNSVPPTASEVHLDDEKTLAQIPTRTERRKASGVVRLIAASASTTAESRGLDLLAPWASNVSGTEGGDDAEEPGEKEEETDSEEEDDEEDDEEDSEVSEEEANEDRDIDMPSPHLPLVIKGKRKSTTDMIAPPSKRVQFSRVTVTQTISKDKSVDKIETEAVRKSALKRTKPLLTNAVKTKLKAKTGGGKMSVADARKAQRVSGVDSSGRKGKKEGLKLANGGGDGAYNFGDFF
jgi:nuclear GTP-binding protein